jgi:catechol 2,3-dioxygenase-like lactoylglutathione lyase family enzyme
MNAIPSKPVSQPAGEVRLQPMLHVQDMEQALRFFEAVGGSRAYGSRDGDWALLRFGNTELSLLRHPPNHDQGDSEFELNFVSTIPLEQLETSARQAGLTLFKPVTDEAFGRQMILRLPSGMLVKVNEIEEDLVR